MAGPPDRRGRRWRWVLGVVVLVVAVGVVAGIRLVVMSRDLSEVRDTLEAAATAVEEGRLADARTALDSATERLVDVNATLYRAPDLRLIGMLPVASQNLAALRDTVRVTLELSFRSSTLLGTAEAFETEDGTLEIPLQEGAVPLAAVAAAEEDLAALLPSLRLPAGFGESSALVLPPITEAQARIADVIDARREQVTNLSHGLAMLEELLGGNGDRRYLVAVANTAEMRGSGGMYLSYGVLHSSGGNLDVGEFGSIDELFLPVGIDPDALDVPADELGRWGSLEPTRLWRNVNLIPDFEEIVPRAEAMYRSATGLPVDGVIQVDPHGLAAILHGTGPVEVAGLGTVTAENVVALTINEAYTLFPDRDQRQEVLGDVAEVVFQRLAEGSYPSLRPLGQALYAALVQRHILFDSARPDVQDAIAHFDTSGRLPAPESDHFLLTTQNRGRDKLDFYLDAAVEVRGQRLPGEDGSLQVTVTLTNTAPPGVVEPAYVFGGDIESEVPRGTYTGILSLYVPNGTQLNPTPETEAAGVRLLADSGRTALGWDVFVPAGVTETLTFDLVLPARPRGGEGYRLELAPIPRVRPTVWNVDVDAGGGTVLRRSGELLVPEHLVPAQPTG